MKKDLNRLKKVGRTSDTSDSQNCRQREEKRCLMSMNAVEDILEAGGKTVTCLDVMRDKVPADPRACMSALILWPVTGEAGNFHCIACPTMALEFLQGAELADGTIIVPLQDSLQIYSEEETEMESERRMRVLKRP